MIATFDRNGIRFQYPTNWSLDFEDGDEGWTATVQSQELSFVLVSLRADADAPAMLADEALAALREEYKELDAETYVGAFQGLPAIGHDINFLTVDTAIECRTRALESPAGPLLVMTQASEYDRDKNGIVLEAILASFRFEDGES
ncbi:MAG: hypothetical protein JNK93_11490 [Planctomycetia bacterium]|nr:hypothetical protein [Planctomycetia bacterium]